MRHDTPHWAAPDSYFFLTICAGERGGAPLIDHGRAERILDSARYYHDQQQWWVNLIVVMPDHLHLMVQFPPDTTMNGLIKNWKRYLARETGVSWQGGFFEHRIRNEESLAEKTQYIRMNPEKAGLVDNYESWPWQGGTLDGW